MVKNKPKYLYQSGFATWILVIGGMILLSTGVIVGKFLPQLSGTQEVPTPTPVLENTPETLEPSSSVSPSISLTGKISGHLIYPSDHIPEQVGVCAELAENTTIKTCVKQIIDPKYTPTGVGFEMELAPGEYYVYSILGDWRAYHNQFVLCGLNAECKDHTKVPIVVTAGSENNNVQPHDWYDTPVPTVSELIPTLKTTIKPIVSVIPSIIKINPDVFKLIPTATPTIKKVVIPTVKINYGF